MTVETIQERLDEAIETRKTARSGSDFVAAQAREQALRRRLAEASGEVEEMVQEARGGYTERLHPRRRDGRFAHVFNPTPADTARIPAGTRVHMKGAAPNGRVTVTDARTGHVLGDVTMGSLVSAAEHRRGNAKREAATPAKPTAAHSERGKPSRVARPGAITPRPVRDNPGSDSPSQRSLAERSLRRKAADIRDRLRGDPKVEQMVRDDPSIGDAIQRMRQHGASDADVEQALRAAEHEDAPAAAEDRSAQQRRLAASAASRKAADIRSRLKGDPKAERMVRDDPSIQDAVERMRRHGASAAEIRGALGLRESEDRQLAEAADSMMKASTHKAGLEKKRGKRDNWVERTGPGGRGGQLPAYVQHVALAIRKRRGVSTSQAIAIAIGTIKRWARGGGDVDATTRAAARKALAEWMEMRGKARADRD